MGKFFNGLFVGLGVGLLIAPLKGNELRRWVSERMSGMKQAASDSDAEPIELVSRQKTYPDLSSPTHTGQAEVLNALKADAGTATSSGTISVNTGQPADEPTRRSDRGMRGVDSLNGIDDLSKPASLAEKRRVGGGPVSS